MLQDYFYSVKIYRQAISLDDFGNMSDDNGVWELNQTVRGMIQPKSGSKVDRNNNGYIVSDYLMYTELSTNILTTDRIYFGNMYYSIENMNDGTGVEMNQSHREFDLLRIGIAINE